MDVYPQGTPLIRRPAAISPVDGSQLTNHTNSTAPANAALSNTAASYTTLGGLWRFANIAGAETDYALFGFQVPVGFRLFLKGVRGTAVNEGAVSATTGGVLDWALGLRSTAVSLATASLRRVPLGIQGLGTASAIGAQFPDLVRRFEPPHVANPGEFVHIILRHPIGTATVSQFIRGTVEVDGFWESA